MFYFVLFKQLYIAATIIVNMKWNMCERFINEIQYMAMAIKRIGIWI